MPAEILTKEDLHEFGEYLIERILKAFHDNDILPKKKYLDSRQVEELLNISSSALQRIRLNGTLPYLKLNGKILYEYKDVMTMLENAKVRDALMKEFP